MHTPAFVAFKDAIKGGFQEKALSILKSEELYFSKGEMKKAFELGKSNAIIIKYLSARSINRELFRSIDWNALLGWASWKGHSEVVKMLLARDSHHRCVDPSACNNNAIQAASVNGHKGVVEMLLTRDDADPSASNNLAIRGASYYGYKEVVKLLLADPRVRRSNVPQDILDKYSQAVPIALK